MITVVVSTIGAPFLLDSLQSLRYWPPDLVVVIDVVGRACSDLDETFPLDVLLAELDERFPKAHVVWTDGSAPWAVMNGCYNLGVMHARHPWIMCTHDDVSFADYDYWGQLAPVLGEIERLDFRVDDYKVIGAVLPEWEVVNRVRVPTVPEGHWGLTQLTTPVSHVIHRGALDVFGWFDTEFGVWYDAQLEAEIVRHNWWSVHLPTPPLRHLSNRTYRTNNWANRFAPDPKWADHPANFVRKYGYAHERRTTDVLIPLSNPRLGLHSYDRGLPCV
jgi:hypothetical protein